MQAANSDCCCCCLVLACRSELVITVAPIAIRAAFSNIHTWTVLKGDLQLAGQVRATSPVLCWGVACHTRCQTKQVAGLICVSFSLLEVQAFRHAVGQLPWARGMTVS